jgi:hypothetical protein
MAQVEEYVGKPSIARRIWRRIVAFAIWTWIPGHAIRYWRAEGAKEERQELIATLTGAIGQLENKAHSHAGQVRSLRTVLGVIRTRHNRIENLRRDGPGDDIELASASSADFRAAAESGGAIRFKGGGK